MSTAKQTGDEVEEFVTKQFVRVSTNAAGHLTEDTPRDTGHASRNWVATIGDAHVGEVEAGAQAAGLAKLAGYKLGDGPVIVANNVPYIQVLNGGSSQKAPAGFVQQAIFDAVADEAGVSVSFDGGGDA